MPCFWEANVVEVKLCITSKPLEGSKTTCRSISRRGFTWLASLSWWTPGTWCSPSLHGTARFEMLSLVSCSTTRLAWALTCLEMCRNCHQLGKASVALLAVAAQVLLLGRGHVSAKHLLPHPEDSPTCGLLSFTVGVCFVMLPALSLNSG